MKIHDVEQGSLEWLALRSGIPTASEADALITPLWKIKTGDGPRTYVIEKATEWWQGGPLPSFQSFAMEQGSILESEAIPWLELAYDVSVRRVGFITTDDSLCGCSPDGLLSDDEGCEIKAPQAPAHVRYLLDGKLPKDYEVQVHFSLFVTGAKRWRFVSYRRGFPNLVLTIERDEEKIEVIQEALENFHRDFNIAKERLTEINGGPPPRLKPLTPMPAKMPTLQRTTTQLSTLHELEIVP